MGDDQGEPTAPATIPTYVREGLDRQDAETLADVVAYCEARIEFLRGTPSEDAVVDESEELVTMESLAEGTRVVKRVPCGKDCSGCPHGPYLYTCRRTGSGLEWEYHGRVDREGS